MADQRREAATYLYRDGEGAALFAVVRFEPKAFEIRDSKGRILPDIPVHVLYRLPEVLAAPPTETIYVVEGEKDADKLREGGLVATTNPGGCRHGWRPEYTEALRGRHCVVLPDADKPGHRHAESVVASLRGAAASVVRVYLPGRGGADVTDWLDGGSPRSRYGIRGAGTVEKLREMVASARYRMAGLTGRPHSREQDRLIWESALTTNEKAVLLAMWQHSRHDGGAMEDVCVTPITRLATLCGLHRITAQNVVSGLRRTGLLRQKGRRHAILWDLLASIPRCVHVPLPPEEVGPARRS